ncbi:MAG: autotransporter outer membrane beta-barrel domain-containing protein [Methylococcaceae bacterium]|nr:autotransporter outer membrane beta-barrel domain-containing protein [Methylococcaceae bacterium]
MKKYHLLSMFFTFCLLAAGNTNAATPYLVASGGSLNILNTETRILTGRNDIAGTLTNDGALIGGTDSAAFLDVGAVVNNNRFLALDTLFFVGKPGMRVLNNNPTGILVLLTFLDIYGGGNSIINNDGLINIPYNEAGIDGYPEFTFMNTGIINNNGRFYVGSISNCMNGANGKIINKGIFEIDVHGKLNDACPSYQQLSGQTIVNGEITSLNSIKIDGGTLSGNGNITGSSVTISPNVTIEPGTTLGTLTINNNLSLNNSSLVIEIGGRAPGQSDRLTVNGNVSLSGTLNVILANGFSPQAGDSFDILTATSVITEFTTVNLPELPSNLNWDLQYLGNRVVLSVI